MAVFLNNDDVKSLLTMDVTLEALERSYKQMIEGAGALALAALLSEKARFGGRTAVLIVSGGNVTPAFFR